MSSIFEYISYRELIWLIVCLTLDSIEYFIPLFLTPFVGDIFDVIGLVLSLYMFGRIGILSALELVPALDLIPINVITWLIWVLSRRWGGIQDAMRDHRFGLTRTRILYPRHA